VLWLAVVSKPKPLIVSVVALAARRNATLARTTGLIVAICTPEPLPTLLLVTTAVRLPAEVGLVENVTVSAVAVAAVTVPTAPLLKTTVLCEAIRSKPKPLIVTLDAFAARFTTLLVTTGETVATGVAAPLVIELDVTIAVRVPALLGFVEKVTVSVVEVAAVTVPTALSLKATVLLAAVVSKPKPLMVIVVAFAATLEVLVVTTGVTDATWTAAPLVMLFEVTTADRLPTDVGFVEKVTVSEVAVADDTVPTAPLLKTTVLWFAVVSKPIPTIVTVEALAASRSPLFAKTTGVTEAI
jgi:hypothetical protein